MRNFVAKLAGEVGVRTFSSLFIFLLARVLGATDFGLYSSAFAYASLFLIVVDLGINPIVTREIARREADRSVILQSANAIKLLATLAALFGLYLLGRWSAFAQQHPLLVGTLGVMVLTYSLIDYMGAALAGKEEMGWEAFLRTLCRAVVAAAGIVVLFWTKSLIAVTVTMSLASIISLLVGGFILRGRFGTFPLGWDQTTVKRLLISGLPLLGSVVFWTFYDNQDILLLNHFHIAERQIGLFWSASKVIDVLKVCPVLVAGAFFPALARFAQTRESFLDTTRSLLAYAFPFLIVVSAIAFLVAPYLEIALYGSQFVEATPLLRTLVLAFVAIFLNHLFMQILIAKDRETQLVPGAVIACLSNLAASWYLIPRHGTMGACYALVVSELIYLIFQTKLVFNAVPGLLNPFRRTYG